MRIYHGGTIVVERPEVSKGREGLDFGKGFYATDLRRQAESWANRMARIRMEKGVVSVYEFDERAAKEKFSYKKFGEYDIEWLNFIVANRRGDGFVDDYDIVGGGVANDRVIDTVEAYMSNMMPLEVALKNLSEHRPNNQICIRSQRVVDECMHFVESYTV